MIARRLDYSTPPRVDALASVPTCQCCVIVLEPNAPVDRRWRMDRYVKQGLDHECCVHRANVEIDGDYYCNRHAGMLALAQLLGEPFPFTVKVKSGQGS